MPVVLVLVLVFDCGVARIYLSTGPEPLELFLPLSARETQG
jgi:hypothetical protein